jgi:glutathione synthase/RimK-type ligase-like ATP-grasp enzyme
MPLAVPVPEHDVALVAVCAADGNRKLLQQLERALATWPKPVVNHPQYIPATDRDTASRLLQNLPGLLMPPTLRASRRGLESIARGAARFTDLYEGCDFTVIVRPVGSHAGRYLEKITNVEELAAYLGKVHGDQFFVSRFIDYRGADGQFRKYRIALIDGEAFACHMGVSEHWMIHYLNAGMYEDAAKRDEEARFMANFGEFAVRHRAALAAIQRRTQLDYVCIDCAETPECELLVFEIDHCAVVHAMDSEDLFPFKQTAMRMARDAFRSFLSRLDQGEPRRLAA